MNDIFLHYIGVFELVFSLGFYYSIILLSVLPLLSLKHCTFPTTLEMGKINN